MTKSLSFKEKTLWNLPCCVNCCTAAGNFVETATGVAPTAGILISAPWGGKGLPLASVAVVGNDNEEEVAAEELELNVAATVVADDNDEDVDDDSVAVKVVLLGRRPWFETKEDVWIAGDEYDDTINDDCWWDCVFWKYI